MPFAKIGNKKEEKYQDPTVWWGNKKKFIQDLTEDYRTRLEKTERKRLQQLQAELKINEIESKIEEIEQHHRKGAMVRSRVQLIESEEKPMKFFYMAEKQNQTKKNITSLQNKNGEIKSEDEEILKIAKEY